MNTLNVVEAVFFAALEKNTPEERGKYLEQACNGDPNLRRTVEKLLNAHPRAEAFLRPPANALPPTLDHPSDERPGAVFGPYKLLHEIGEGGMGTVWMAEQTEPVKRRVALKVIKPGMDSKQVLARFEAERQALALMDHPNIAKVLDAGATENGRPYFVMELMKGQPITEFCDKNRLTTRERLELFVAVCQATQHAHQKGIIHRDIKPSNVLVALYDGKPVPKVIDFGVAKATAEPLTDKTLFTRHGQVVGTFEYMSPEQATLDQLDIDTRSDVYSLGVLLYELLTGTTPLDKDRLRQGGLGEILRLIREEEPPKPSTRLTTTPGLLATAAAYRKSDAQKLTKVVRGELDWIVMKALDKDRNRRFATANGLADDIERYLKDEPVQACPPTLGYRLRKYARKHKVAFTTMSAIAAALLVGIALASWQAVRATQAEHATAAERDHTADERDKAVRLGQALDIRLGEINAAKAQQRVDQYAWDLQTFPLTWEAGSTAEARRMLERQPRELRGFEWHYWKQQMHTERASIRLPGLPDSRAMQVNQGGPNGPPLRSGNWVFSGDGTRLAYFAGAEGFRATSNDKPAVLVWDIAGRKLLLSHVVAEVPEGAAVYGNVAGSISLSHDGKRVSVAASIAYAVNDPVTGAPMRFKDELARNLVRVIDVDSGAVRFDSGKFEGEDWTRPSARLSADGRKLVTHTPPPIVKGQKGARGYGRSALWDLDATGKKAVAIENASIGMFSPDGSRIMGFAQDSGTKAFTKIWDAASGQELLSFPGTGVVASPNWTYLATVVLDDKGEGEDDAGQVRTLKVFDGATGKEISTAPLTGALPGQTPRGGNAATFALPIFSPDESLVAVAHNATSGNQRMDWFFVEPKTGKIRHNVEDPGPARDFGLGRPVRRLFSGDGSQFICIVDNAIHAFRIAAVRTAGQPPIRTLRGHVNLIVAAAPASNPDDLYLHTIEADGTLKQWDLQPRPSPPKIAVAEEPGREAGEFIGPLSRAYRVSAGGEWVALAKPGRDGKPDTVHVWDVPGKGTTILEAPPLKRPVTGSSDVYRAFISDDGKRVALYRSVGRRGGFGTPLKKLETEDAPPKADVTVWDVASKALLRNVELPAEFNLFAGMLELSGDGSTIVVTRIDSVQDAGKLPPSGDNRPRVTLWTIDVASGREGPAIVLGGTILPANGALSPDGQRLVAYIRIPGADGAWTDQFAVWDLARGTQVFAISPKSIAAEGAQDFDFGSLMRATSWSPDGSRVAILNGASPSIALVDAATGKLIRTLNPSTRGAANRPPRIAFSPDGRRIALEIRVRLGMVISVLDTDSGKEVLSLPVTSQATGGFFGQDAALNRLLGASLTFSSDGHRLLLFARGSSGPIAKGPQETYLRVRTWDATPLPEPPQ